MSGPGRGLRLRLAWLALAAAVAGGAWLYQDQIGALGGRDESGADGAEAVAASDRTVDDGLDPARGSAARAEVPASGSGGAGDPDEDPEDAPSGAAASGAAGAGPEAGGTAGDPPDDRGGGEPGGSAAGGAEADPAGAGTSPEPVRDPAERLRRLFGPDGSGRVELDSADLALLLGPQRPWRLPDGVTDPGVVPRDSLLEASANVELDRVLGDRLPAMLRRMIGDSSRVTARLSPGVPSRGVLRIRVRDVRAGSVSFPQAMVPWMLTQLGLPTAADDPAAVELAPGRGLSGARVEEGVLVLAREPGR